MSIINDALKKAKNAKGSSYSQGTFRQNLTIETQTKSKQINWGPIFVLMVLFLITGPLIAPVFSTTFKRTNLASVPSLPSRTAYQVPLESAALSPSDSVENRKAQFGLEEMPLNSVLPTPVLTSPRLDLTGIVFSQNTSYCIINDKVMKAGDEIGGAELTLVESNLVKLLYQGKEIVLTLPE